MMDWGSNRTATTTQCYYGNIQPFTTVDRYSMNWMDLSDIFYYKENESIEEGLAKVSSNIGNRTLMKSKLTKRLTKGISIGYNTPSNIGKHLSCFNLKRNKVGYGVSVRNNSTDAKLTHITEDGKATMVDVGPKDVTSRTAVASGKVTLGPVVFKAVKENELKKGSALDVARIAGIMAAKQTSLLIPLCHNIPLTKISVDFELDAENCTLGIVAMVSTVGRTGVEMEALTAVSVSALTVYDMCKALSHDLVIKDIRLDKKRGGKSGDYARNDE